jgi:hypothetical protein
MATKMATSTKMAARFEEACSLRKLFIFWCPEGELNPHGQLRPADFKSAASASFAIRAGLDSSQEEENR